MVEIHVVVLIKNLKYWVCLAQVSLIFPFTVKIFAGVLSFLKKKVKVPKHVLGLLLTHCLLAKAFLFTRSNNM